MTQQITVRAEKGKKMKPADIRLSSTVYAVEVVRCKDCVYYEQFNNNEYYCDAIYRDLHGDDEGVTFEPPEDYFCAYGKRREEK